MRAWLVLAGFLVVSASSGAARAEGDAVVQVAVDDDVRPPPRFERDLREPPEEPYRSPVRLSLGPAAATTGRGLGPGLGVAAELGRGPLGARLSAAWMHGEPAGGAGSPIGGGLSQYVAEMTLDVGTRGALHPVVGLGLGAAHAQGPSGSGTLGIGTARAALEYALPLRDTDARVGVGVLGALPGPADGPVADLRGWGLLEATLTMGF